MRVLKKATVLAMIGLGLVVGTTTLAQDAADTWQAPARAAKKKNPVASDEKSIADGKSLYVQECLACHGDSGKGDGPSAKDLERKPGDLSNPKMWAQTDGALFWKITEGKKPMPTYEQKFTEDQRWAVVNYLRTLAPKPQEK